MIQCVECGWGKETALLEPCLLLSPEDGKLGATSLNAGLTTPAEAGAQLGDESNDGLCFITSAFPPGPRPSPGWRLEPGGRKGWLRRTRLPVLHVGKL
jgi:hypothetical protein